LTGINFRKTDETINRCRFAPRHLTAAIGGGGGHRPPRSKKLTGVMAEWFAAALNAG
jgi:hypothetical protein